MNCVEENRLGKIEVYDMFFTHETDETLKKMFEDLIIIRAEQLFHKRSIEYIAYSKKFRICEPDHEPPRYNMICSREKNKPIVVKFEEINE